MNDVATFLLTHDGNNRLGHPQQAEEVGFKLITGLLFGGFLNRAKQTKTCAVDQYIDPVEVLLAFVYSRENGIPIVDI
ncbi:hypothetical protein GCM10028810_63030 [Spirosoma litoris]